MAIHDLVRKETPHGTVTAVWFDSDDENFVVQHEFVHLSFHKREFKAFLDCLNESYNNTWRTTVGLVSAVYLIRPFRTLEEKDGPSS